MKRNLLDLLRLAVDEEKFSTIPKHEPAAIVQPDWSGAEVSDPFEVVRLKRVGEDADFFRRVVDPAGKFSTIRRPGEGSEDAGIIWRIRNALWRLFGPRLSRFNDPARLIAQVIGQARRILRAALIRIA